jgi:NAD-dependent deacetylase
MQVILEQATQDILSCKKLVVLTGAGISASSGLPTYRGSTGIYTKSFIKPELLMSSKMMELFPWFLWQKFRSYYKSAKHLDLQPTYAHQILAALQNIIYEVGIITQNVDNLHTTAGSKNVIELHGNVTQLICVEHRNHIRNITNSDIACFFRPKCHICGAKMRPNVVLFGEYLQFSNKIAVENLMFSPPDILMIIGTSISLSHIKEITDYCRSRNVKIITIKRTPDEYLQSISDYVFYMTADDFFTKFMQQQVVTQLFAHSQPSF